MKTPTILVVDDEKGFLQILNIILQRAGYHPLLADNPFEGRKLAQQMRPDAIILDDNMPELTGGEICYALKQDPSTRSIPVIMYSAGSRISSDEYVQHIGAEIVLRKPAMPADILSAVEQCLNNAAV